MAEDNEELKHEGEVETPPKSDDKPAPAALPAASFPTVSVYIWPPSQRTRDVVIERLIQSLSFPAFIFYKRYGALPSDEASVVARQIEQEAFDLASSNVSPPSAAIADDVVSAEASVDKGFDIFGIYSKELIRRMIESVKTKGSSVSQAPAEDNAAPAAEDNGPVTDSVPTPTEPIDEDEI